MKITTHQEYTSGKTWAEFNGRQEMNENKFQDVETN